MSIKYKFILDHYTQHPGGEKPDLYEAVINMAFKNLIVIVSANNYSDAYEKAKKEFEEVFNYHYQKNRVAHDFIYFRIIEISADED